jgi:hypothetical protein
LVGLPPSIQPLPAGVAYPKPNSLSTNAQTKMKPIPIRAANQAYLATARAVALVSVALVASVVPPPGSPVTVV